MDNITYDPPYHITFRERQFDSTYVEGDSWRCDQSPTGSHHMIVELTNGDEIGVCRNCGAVVNYSMLRRERNNGN